MIPYYRPFYDHRELLAALRPGPARESFENAVATRAGVSYGLAFAYGRLGLLAALRALGITDGEIVLPAYTCLVMAHAVLASGNRLAFADVRPDDYNMDLDALRQALTPQTRAIVATHMYGYPADVDAIRAMVGDERVLIVEDCALGVHTLAAGGGGVRGDLGLYSLGAAKPLSTYEGGVLVTHSAGLYERIRAYRDREMNCPLLKATARRWVRFLTGYVLFRKTVYGRVLRPKSTQQVGVKFDLPPDYMPGDSRMPWPHFQARIGLVQLEKLEPILERRRAVAYQYHRALQDCPGVQPAPWVDGATYSHYTVRIPDRDMRRFEQRMRACGVAVDRAYDYALPYLEAYRPFARGEYPIAAQLAREVLNLPCYPHLSAADVRAVANCVRELTHVC